MDYRRAASVPRPTQLLAVVVVMALYYASQWLTQQVQLAVLLPLPVEVASATWVVRTDHHVVQLCFALVCIWYLGRDWRLWGLNTTDLRASKRLLTRGFLPILLVFLFLGEFLVPVVSDTPPAFDYELSAFNVVGMLLFMGVVSGLSEEILFRGLIQTYLSRYFDSGIGVFGHTLPLAGLITAALFTIAHVGFTVLPFEIYHLSVPQLVLSFVLGVYYAIAYYETESLVAPILAHNAVNGTIMAATFLAAWVLGG